MSIYLSGTVGGTARSYIGMTPPVVGTSSTYVFAQTASEDGSFQVTSASNICYFYKKTGTFPAGSNNIRGEAFYEF